MSLNIQLSKDVFLLSDTRNYILAKKKVNKNTGEVDYRHESFFGRLSHVVDHILERGILDSDATTLKEIVENQERIKAELSAVFEKNIKDHPKYAPKNIT